MNSFTAGQITRAQHYWATYRAGTSCHINCESTIVWPFQVVNLLGGQQFCVDNIDLFGSPTAVTGTMTMKASPADAISWASDFFVVIYDPSTKRMSHQRYDHQVNNIYFAGVILCLHSWPSSGRTHRKFITLICFRGISANMAFNVECKI